MKAMKLVLAAALAVGSASALASSFTEGGGYEIGYPAAYQAAVNDAGDLCSLLGGRPGPTVIVIDSTYMGGGYYSVLVQRVCFGI
ncbi:hypothetical protein [Ahniella affigens]|nr:hypothetical protein [Ahniella affigens]